MGVGGRQRRAKEAGNEGMAPGAPRLPPPPATDDGGGEAVGTGQQAPSPRDQPLSLFAADQAPSQHSKIFGYTSNEMMAAHKDAVVIANFQQNNR